MAATKKLTSRGVLLFAGLLTVLAGCTPPGPRALLEGRDLLEAGRWPQAVERLTVATSLLPTNAHAWNYLGLAYHRTGEATRAAEAYRRALLLDRDLFEARFNLGCLWLDQGKADAAKSEFTACTLRRPDSFDAWLRLGTAHYRLGELTAAEASLQKARQLDPHHPEVLNALGLVCARRQRTREAVAFFEAALKQQPDYRPALLNLATVLRRDVGDISSAAQKYREYLALEPQAPQAGMISGILQSLQQKPVAVTNATITSPATNLAVTAVVRPLPAVPTVSSPPRSNPPTLVAKTPAAPLATSVQHVVLPPEPVIQPAAPVEKSSPVATAVSSPVETSQIVATSPPPVVSAEPVNSLPEKRSFLSRLNPFRAADKPRPKSVEIPPNTPAAATTSPLDGEAVSRAFPRYTYLSPPMPVTGERGAAEAALARGRIAEQAGNMAQAAAAYQQAAKADPAYFEARYQLGLAHYALRDYSAALGEWEQALAIRPDSGEARYNFALALKVAGYVPDAAAELEKILAANPKDVRAHLLLGNLCAEQLRDNRRARVHYRRILELDSRHPQATAIRYWLVAHPG